ncbi:beta-lactamase [Mycobacterium tuberculosis]|nr:beta-lactamase [Mycobacterium tuberculosis]
MDVQARAQELADGLVASGAEVGLQIAAYLHGELIVDVHAGRADASTGRPVDDRTLFDVPEMGLVATVVHVLAERGLIEYGVPVAAYWPEFGAHGKTGITVAHVLTHSAGVPQAPDGLVPEDFADWDALCARVADMRPLWRPGTAVGAHVLTFGIILGEVVRRVTGRPIADVLRAEVAAPLGIADDLFFGVPARHLPRLARMEGHDSTDPVLHFPEGSLFQRVVPPAWRDGAELANRTEYEAMSMPCSGRGTAQALARLYAALIGEVDGVRLFPPELTSRLPSTMTMRQDRVMGGPIPRGLGFGVASVDTASYTAFGDTNNCGVAFADPSRGLSVAVLFNLLALRLPAPGYEIADEIRAVLGLEPRLIQAVRRRQADRAIRRFRRRAVRRRRRDWTSAD